MSEANSVFIDEDRPYPWAVFRDHPQTKDIAYVRSAGSSHYHREICTLYNDACRHAQLLAAAPELLASLKDLLHRSENEGWAYSADEREAALAAIAKAEVRS